MGKRAWLSRLGGKNGMGPGLLNLQSSSIYVQGQQDQIIVPLWYNTISYFSCATAPLLKYLTCSSPQKLTSCFLGISIMLVVLFSLTFTGPNCKACLCEAWETYRLSYQWDWRTEEGGKQQKWGRKSFLNYQTVFRFLGWQWEAVNLLGCSVLLKTFIIIVLIFMKKQFQGCK
mgnify:CR=1 FL=1